MQKITLNLSAVNGGPFNCLPARSVEVEPGRVKCNDVTFPWENHPHNMRLWVIGAEYGPFGAVWASHEQDALDELIDSNLGDALLISEDDQASATDEEREEWAHLGNAGEPCDLTNVWIQTVDLSPTAENAKLLCLLSEARGACTDSLDN